MNKCSKNLNCKKDARKKSKKKNISKEEFQCYYVIKQKIKKKTKIIPIITNVPFLF